MEKVNIIEKDGKKYIDGEEILYEYDCMTNWIFIRFFLSSFILYAIYSEGYINQGKHFEALIAFIFVFVIMIGWFFIDIKTLINQGIYITKNKIITFTGKKIPLDDIFYKWAGGGIEWGSVALRLYNKKKLIISCLVKDDEYYNQMIAILEKVSNNQNLRNFSLRDGKRKLKLGENNGRAGMTPIL